MLTQNLFDPLPLVLLDIWDTGRNPSQDDGVGMDLDKIIPESLGVWELGEITIEFTVCPNPVPHPGWFVVVLIAGDFEAIEEVFVKVSEDAVEIYVELTSGEKSVSHDYLCELNALRKWISVTIGLRSIFHQPHAINSLSEGIG